MDSRVYMCPSEDEHIGFLLKTKYEFIACGHLSILPQFFFYVYILVSLLDYIFTTNMTIVQVFDLTMIIFVHFLSYRITMW